MGEGAASGWQDLLGGLVDVARDYVGTGIRIAVKTNYTPEIPIATASLGAGGGSSSSSPARRTVLGELLGVKAAVVVRNQSGAVIATYGEVPKTDPVRAVLALALVGGVLYLVVRGVLK